jgi:hypothetical protein
MTFEQALARCEELEHLVEKGPGWDEIALTRSQAIIAEFLDDLRIRGYHRRALSSLDRWFRAFFEQENPLQQDPSTLLAVMLRRELELLRKYVVRAFQPR